MLKQIVGNTINYLLEKPVEYYLKRHPNKVLTNGPLTGNYRGMAARTSIDWYRDSRFAKAFDTSWSDIESLDLNFKKKNIPEKPMRREHFNIEWDTHVICWAAEYASRLPYGDFIECGVGVGFYSRCIMEYIRFNDINRKFWLLDRWADVSVDHLYIGSEKERNYVSSFTNDFDIVEKLFDKYENAILIRGLIPETLEKVTSTSFSFVSLDLNSASPEISAAEFIWPKLVPGGIIVLDDFGHTGSEVQKEAFQKFFNDRSVSIFYCPTGQGIIIKPYA